MTLLDCRRTPFGATLPPLTTTSLDFRSAFCAQAHCADAAFEQTLFRRALYWHARPLVWLIRRLEPEFFGEDVGFIRWLGGARSLAEAEEDIYRFGHDNQVRRRWLRTGLRLHLSPRRLQRLASGCMAF